MYVHFQQVFHPLHMYVDKVLNWFALVGMEIKKPMAPFHNVTVYPRARLALFSIYESAIQVFASRNF